MTVPGEPAGSLSTAAVRATGLRKIYGSGETAVAALAGVDVAFGRGEFTAIMGPSGSGKSTLMHCLAGLDTATSGQVWLGGTELTRLRDDQLTRLRRERIGFVFPDEPTGNLDSRAGAEVLDLLRSSVRETGQTVVMVTHDPTAASYADRVVLLADGRPAGEVERPTAASVLEALRGLGG